MHGCVALPTDDQGFAPAGCHALDPRRLFPLAWSVHICQFAQRVPCTGLPRAAYLTYLRQQALHHRTPCAADCLRLVVEARVPVPSEVDATKPGDPWRVLRASCVSHRAHPEGALGCGYRRAGLPVHRMHTRAMCLCAGLHQGRLQDPVDTPPAMDVVRHPGVLDEAPVCCWVLRHDAVVGIVAPCRHVERLASPHVVGPWRSDDRHGALQSQGAVETAPAQGTALRLVGVRGDEVVAEDACGCSPRMGEQGGLG